MNDYWKTCEQCGRQGDDHHYFEGQVLCSACKEKALFLRKEEKK